MFNNRWNEWKIQSIQYVTILIAIAGLMVSCNKENFLGKKPSSRIVVPTTIEELRGLLDHEENVWESPILGVQSSDEYFWPYEVWNAAPQKNRNAYIWENIANAGTVQDWDKSYKQIFIANNVLEGIELAIPNPQQLPEWRSIKGGALFLRAKSLFGMAEVFCLPYDEATADSDLGLPLRLRANVNDDVQRSSLQQTYDQIISDLNEAVILIEEETIHPNRLRPTKLSAYALLSRVYLSQRKYELAGSFANAVLDKYSTLMDYNGLSLFAYNNDEVIYQNVMSYGTPGFSRLGTTIIVDPQLYDLYDANDLRKTLFFRTVNGNISLNRSYSGLALMFSGLATDEMYLIRAEWYARNNELEKAAKDINDLLVKRYINNEYSPVSFADKQEALSFVLTERRKELVFRGARWRDVRRLNKEGYNITMTRNLNGTIYTLPPNDLRYALSIPQYEINLSGIEQNPSE